MMRGIFDTHTHYDHELFAYVRHATLAGLAANGVSLVLNCGSDMDSSLYSIELSEQYPFVYAACGVHPHEAKDAPKNIAAAFTPLFSSEKVVAVGEIGLDYHYNHSPPAIQRRVFEQFLELANRLSLPVILHDREAHDDLYAMLQEYRPQGVVHRYSGDRDLAERLLDLGLYLGFGCAITYPASTDERDVARHIPLDRLLLETDCPYLAPYALRGTICTSDMISYAAKEISRLRPDYSPQEIVDIAHTNGLRLFSIPSPD